MDVGKVHNPWHEDVDLEPLETGFVPTGVPVQNLPPIIGVSRLDSVEPIVLRAKFSLDSLRTARVRSEAKDIEVLIQTVSERADVRTFLGVSTVTHLWLATVTRCVELTRHPSDKATVPYPNILERLDNGVCDLEDLPVTRHVGEGGEGVDSTQDRK